jgi:hypothetical protein
MFEKLPAISNIPRTPTKLRGSTEEYNTDYALAYYKVLASVSASACLLEEHMKRISQKAEGL